MSNGNLTNQQENWGKKWPSVKKQHETSMYSH